MSSNRWNANKNRRLAKNWALNTTNPSGSSPSYTISDVLTAELLKGASDSGRSSSKHSSQQRGVITRSTAMVAETELSVSIPNSGPLFDLSYYSRLMQTENIVRNKAGSDGSRNSGESLDVRRRHAKLNQIPEQFSEFILEQNAVTDSTRTRQISDLMGSQATIFSTRENGRSSSRSSRFRQKSVKAGIDYAADGYNTPKRRGAIRFKPGGKIYRFYARMRRFASSFKSRFTLAWEFVARSKRAKATSELGRLKLTSRSTRRRQKALRAKISGPVNNPHLGMLGGAERVSSITEKVRAMAGNLPAPATGGNPFHEGAGKLSHLSNYIKEQKDMTPVTVTSRTVFLADASAPPTPPPHETPASAFETSPQVQPVPQLGANTEGISNYNYSDPQDIPSPNLTQFASQVPENKEILDNPGIVLWRRYLSNVTALRIRLRQEIALFQALAAGQAIPSFFNYHNKAQMGTEPIGASEDFSRKDTIAESDKLENTHPSSVSYIMSQKASILETIGDRSRKSPMQKHHSDSSLGVSLIKCKSSVEETGTEYSYSLAQSKSAYSVHLSSKSSFLESRATSLVYSDSSDIETIDENVDKFQQVLNRRSMLGEMLDYNSEDDCSTITSQASLDTVDSVLVRRYGTILSAHGSANLASRPSLRYTPDPSPGLTRSPGFNSNLHLIS